MGRLSDDFTKQVFVRAQKYCPVRTGVLKRSAKIVKRDYRLKDIVYDADYASFVHRRNPWLRRAASEVASQYKGKAHLK